MRIDSLWSTSCRAVRSRFTYDSEPVHGLGGGHDDPLHAAAHAAHVARKTTLSPCDTVTGSTEPASVDGAPASVDGTPESPRDAPASNVGMPPSDEAESPPSDAMPASRAVCAAGEPPGSGGTVSRRPFACVTTSDKSAGFWLGR